MDEGIFDAHNGEGPSEAEFLVLQANASSCLAANASGRIEMAAALLDTLWGGGCGTQVATMTIWAGMAHAAVRSIGAEGVFVVGKQEEDGTARIANTDEIDQVGAVVEAFMNLLGNEDAELMEQALNAMHDFLHESEEAEGRGAFFTVLTVATETTKSALKVRGLDLDAMN